MIAPSSSNPIIFDGTANSQISSNSACTFSSGTGEVEVGSITFRNGYNALISINDNVALFANGGIDMDVLSTLNVDFGNSATFGVNDGGNFTNMTLGGSPSGSFILGNGTFGIGSYSTLEDTIGVNVTVGAAATLFDLSNSSLLFGNNNLTLSVIGRMIVDYGSGTGLTLINNNGYSNDYINVAAGTLEYKGSGGVTDKFTVPVEVQNNGTFLVHSDTGQPNGAKLIVQDASNFIFPNGSKESVYMDDTLSESHTEVNLAQGATLECDNDYYQGFGYLSTDATTCTLQDGNNSQGSAVIAGGAVVINPSGTGTYGTLKVNANNLVLGGQLQVDIAANFQGPNPGPCDLLYVSGITNLLNSSTLAVSLDNPPPQAGDYWVIIQDGEGNNIQGNFQMPIQTFPQTNLNATVNPKDNTEYLLNFRG